MMLSVQNGKIYRMHDVNDVYYVQSESKHDKFYRITLSMHCECKDFEIRGGPCKHVIEVLQYLVADKNKKKKTNGRS
jgi:ribonuclease BN (tRNA processing enzyme)